MGPGNLQDRVRLRLQDEVCRNCVYRTADAGCGLPEDHACPIFSRVDRIIDVVRTVRSDRIEPYVERLRQTICACCRMEDEFGSCKLRERSDCALDDYFPLIVDLVEQELGRETAAPRRMMPAAVGVSPAGAGSVSRAAVAGRV